MWFETLTLGSRDYGWMLWRRETPTNVTRKAWGPAAADTTSLIGKARIAETLGEGGEVLLPTKQVSQIGGAQIGIIFECP